MLNIETGIRNNGNTAEVWKVQKVKIFNSLYSSYMPLVTFSLLKES